MRSIHRAMGPPEVRRRALAPTACLLAAALSGCVTARSQRAGKDATAPTPTSARSAPGLPPMPEVNPRVEARPGVARPAIPTAEDGPPIGESQGDRWPSPRRPRSPETASKVGREEVKADPAVRATAARLRQEESTSAAGPTPPAPPSIPAPAGTYPLDLTTALQLADAENPTIARARTGILEALALQKAARALLLPTLNAGTNYHGHNGVLQRSSGRILSLSEQSLYVGGGARTLAAETLAIPAVNIASPLTEALLEPLVARQRLTGSRFEASATALTVLGEVADRYIELLGAEAVLEAQRLSETQAGEIAKIVGAYAATGEGRPANAQRAEADRMLLRVEVQRAEEEVAVASARLAQRLNLDPSVQLRPLLSPLEPLALIDAAAPAEDLVRTALTRRPEVGARSAAIGLAETKLTEERVRPFLPTLWLGFSGGGFGGGSNLVPPLLGNFGGRTDFDVRAFWTLQNLGVGNFALQKRRRAEVGQAVAERSRVFNQIRSEVAAARAEVLARRNTIEVARRELATAEAGYREDLLRTRAGAGRPIEVLDNLRLLAGARVNLIRAVTRYNQAQFRLFVALGSPPPLDPSSPGPVAPPPITTPLRAPIASCPAPPCPHP
jgi:outer membrane protein TolC